MQTLPELIDFILMLRTPSGMVAKTNALSLCCARIPRCRKAFYDSFLGWPRVQYEDFRRIAGKGVYEQGDFDNEGLQRNVEARGAFFEAVHGNQHSTLMRADESGSQISVMSRAHCAGFVIHTPCPRHWVALVPPWPELEGEFAAVLCDSLHTSVYGLTTNTCQDLFEMMGVRQLNANGRKGLSSWEQQEEAAEWSAYSVMLQE